MQKKIIALAVAGLVSGAAFAQSNVTVYGIVDMGYVYKGSHVDDNTDSYSALDDGGWDSSRFGLMGTEDLGNGLSANFKQEFATALDRNIDVTSRNSYVSLAGKSWGEVKLGSFGSVHDDYAGWGESGGMSWGNGAFDLLVNGDARNAVEYISPNFSGLQFKVGASSNYENQQDDSDDSVAEQQNRRAYFGSAAYANGGLKIALTYDNVNEQNTDWAKDEWMIAGGYDFGVVKVGAAYDRSTWDNTVIGDAERDAYRLTIGAPIGANGAISLSYINSSIDLDNMDDLDADAWGISYSHFLSKRTALYVAGYVGDYDQGALVTETENSSVPEVTGYESGIKFGVRHTF